MLAIRSARLFDGMADQLRPRPLVLVDQGRIIDVDVTGADPPEGPSWSSFARRPCCRG